MNKALEAAAARIARYRRDPVYFVREEFGAEPDEWQREFLEAYANGERPRTYAKACKGPGKTTVIAWCCWHFLLCYKHCKIPATSITIDNLRNNLWAEMSKWQQKSKTLTAAFTWTATRIYANDHPETWFMVALGWSLSATAEQQANSLAGYHADNIMFVLDEMGGIPDNVASAAEAVLANAGTEVNPNAVAKIIGAGNPTHLTGPLYRACTKEASICNVIEITGDPDSPRRSKRISITWAREQIHKYGADNSWVLVNVFGKFPPASMNALIGPDDMQAAMNRHVPIEVYRHSVKVLGVDVARQGDDRTVIAPRQGIVCFQPKILRIPDFVQIAGHVAQAIIKFKPDVVNVDATGGWGYGVIDTLRNWGHTVNAIEFAGKADNHQYFNKRTEMAFNFALEVKGGICLPPLDELKEEACAQIYTHKKDKMALIEKDQIKATLGRSPDLWDAYALTYAVPAVKRDPLEAFQQQDPDYDPLAAMRGRASYEDEKVADYNPLH